MSNDTSETTSIKQLETSSNKDDTSGWIAPSEWECLLLGEKSAKVIIILLMLIFSMRV